MNYKKHTLKNGLRVITVPMPQVKSVAAMILVGVGSRYEKRDQQGVAHFIEHMCFKGTKKRPTPLAIAAEMDGIGAVFNAFTSHELTGFYVKAGAKHLPLCLDVLTDILLNSKFDKTELERERGVILEERRMYRDDPKDHVWDLYGELVFGDHPLGWPVIGQEETIKAVSRKDLVDYCRRWYKPGNIAVVIAGAMDEQKAVREVRRLLGRLRPAKWEKALPFKPPSQETRIKIEKRKTDQTHLMLGVLSYPLDHPKRYTQTVLDAVLGSGKSSRLFIEVRDKRGLGYYVGSSTLPFTDGGTFFVAAGVGNRRVDEALEVIVGELKRLKSKLVPEKELTKAKEMIKGRLALALEESDYVAQFIAAQEMLKGRIDTPEKLMEKVDAVTASQVREVARDIFTSETLNLALIGPFDDEARSRLVPVLTL